MIIINCVNFMLIYLFFGNAERRNSVDGSRKSRKVEFRQVSD